MGKSLSSKYGQKLLDSAKTPATDPIKTASKRAIQKTVATIYLQKKGSKLRLIPKKDKYF